MNPTIILFSSVFTFSVIASSLLFLITKERFQMAVFLTAVASSFFVNQLYLATKLNSLAPPILAYIFIGFTIIATCLRFLTNRCQPIPKCLLIISIFGSLIGAFFF